MAKFVIPENATVFDGLIWCDWLDDNGLNPFEMRSFLLEPPQVYPFPDHKKYGNWNWYWFGYGNGYGNEDGDGNGDGYGNGDGNGYGNGYGNGNWYGDGNGDGDGD